MKILLLNPPAKKKYVRSYYCGSSSKGDYLFQPLDLLMLSGILAKDFNVFLIDAIAENIKEKETLDKILKINPDVIIFLASCVSWDEDEIFLKKIKKTKKIKIIGNGDIFFDDPENILKKYENLDAIIFDFYSYNINNYLKNNFEKLDNIIIKEGNDIKDFRVSDQKEKKVKINIPKHEMFISKKYSFPFSRNELYTSVLTNFGCLFNCIFCIGNKINFYYRDYQDIIEELKYIKNLKIKEIFFQDLTFGIPKINSKKLCEAMIENNFKFSWSCFSRIDVLDYEMIKLMKKAGCHTIIFGVESGSDKVLEYMKKGFNTKQIRETFSICKKEKIETVATFILGLPIDDIDTCKETINFAKSLKCDYASFNMAVPRPKTNLRNEILEKKLISKENLKLDHSGQNNNFGTKYLSKEELNKIHKKAIREFYLRPSYIFNRITKLKSYYQFKKHIREALFIWIK